MASMHETKCFHLHWDWTHNKLGNQFSVCSVAWYLIKAAKLNSSSAKWHQLTLPKQPKTTEPCPNSPKNLFPSTAVDTMACYQAQATIPAEMLVRNLIPPQPPAGLLTTFTPRHTTPAVHTNCPHERRKRLYLRVVHGSRPPAPNWAATETQKGHETPRKQRGRGAKRPYPASPGPPLSIALGPRPREAFSRAW